MIGCIVIARWHGAIIGLKCAKGRGIICPGGKWEHGETFSQCAGREFFEETGMVAKNLQFKFGGESEEGYYTYVFTGEIDCFEPSNSKEGTVTLTNYAELKQSKFGGFYELLEMLGI